MADTLPPLSIDDVTRLDENPFETLNALLNAHNVAHTGPVKHVPLWLLARDPDGKPLGETPVLLELPRSRTPVTFWLRKPGFEPQIFKLIPHQSQPITVILQREQPVQQSLAQRQSLVQRRPLTVDLR